MLKLITLPPQHLTFSVENEDFRAFAIKAHGDQQYGDYPYAIHLADVEHCLTSHSFNSYHDRAVGWLHDVIEDTKETLESVTAWYGEGIAGDVDACTGVGPNRKARNESIYRKLTLRPEAAPYKTADRLVNMKMGLVSGNLRKLAMYVGEFKDFSGAVRPLMHATTKHSLLWNDLEAVVAAAHRFVQQNSVAKAA
jgi:(p)ppGpp synthase/HD superfamily hydrolase